nr:MAG TPA: hypothetical protein [Caudoviricetes sp.]
MPKCQLFRHLKRNSATLLSQLKNEFSLIISR